VAASALLPRQARAETADEVRADALFKEGMQKYDQGQVAPACAAFNESLRLDPKLGTLLNLALCHEKQGKLATAWLEFNIGAAWATQVGQKERREYANGHAFTLEGKLSRVILHLPPSAEISTVEVDGEPLPEPRWYEPLYLDPGEHTIAVGAPGKYRRTVKVSVPREPTAQLVAMPKLQDADPSLDKNTDARAMDAAASDSSTRRTAGFIAGGVGAAGLILGGVFGAIAIGNRNDMSAHCAGSVCDSVGVAAHDDAQRNALLSTIGFGVGIVGIATGAYLLLTTPQTKKSANERAVHAFVGPNAAGIGGVF
jgi:hypothetical protein